MKKILSLMVMFSLFCGLAIASPKTELEKILKDNKIDASIKSIENLADGLKLVKMQHQNSLTIGIASENGKVLFPLTPLLSRDQSIMQKISKAQLEINENNAKNANAALKDVFKEYDKYVFSFKAKKNTNKVIYVVSDPVCPYCKEELDRLDARLNDANVKMLVVGALGDNAISKAAYINANKTENQSKNLALLKKIYNAKSTPKKVDESQIKEITNKTMGTGIRGVPYVFE